MYLVNSSVLNKCKNSKHIAIYELLKTFRINIKSARVKGTVVKLYYYVMLYNVFCFLYCAITMTLFMVH